MTTIVLQSAGAFLGGLVGGPAGAAIGRGLGALAGSAVDQRLFGAGDRVIEGPRLEGSQVMSSHEGAVVPQAFGRVRLSGEVIWATRFEEVQETDEQGGKGGPTTTTVSYSYFANFALALCEGEIGGIGRVWADGKTIDLSLFAYRLHRGGEEQLPDSLIEAKQASVGSEAPAYRGTAYIVFERFPVADYGNRIPQIAVEVLRPVGPLAQGVRAVSVIPASTEFGYDPEPVAERVGTHQRRVMNRHGATGHTDWTASIDALQASLPRVERASLVVAWFGTDLRAERCGIEPRVTTAQRTVVEGERWSVAGRTRSRSSPVSRMEGRAAYGGTPSDGSVRRAIADLSRRGLAVTFNPFVLMDIPPDNPAGQPAYPWRGRIVPEDPVAGSAAFEAAYREMVLHYARLCRGTAIDLFVIGSELRGLTQARASNGSYPFVKALRRLAADVRAILGPNVRITYGADWSEYSNHRDGADVRFPLDALWADPNIDLVGIDNYLPLTDWREGGDPEGLARSPLDPRALAAGIEGGEYFDWFYATPADRAAGRRTPITDGEGEPWIYRTKDIRSWWASAHHERIDGVRSVRPTEWRARSKPIAFLELGCAAIRAGANQPNVFLDAKSSESFLPHHSDGSRDDEMQAAFLEAHLDHWHGDPMIDEGLTHVWCWDARPWPDFPARTDIWSDGENWARGHWLNGRAAGLRVRDLLASILARAGIGNADLADVEGTAMGYVLASPATPRAAIEGVLDLYGIDASERGGRLVFRSRGLDPAMSVPSDDIVDTEGEPRVTRTLAQEGDLPRVAVLEHLDPAKDFQPAASRSRRLTVASRRDASLSLPIVLEAGAANALVERWLHRRWASRETIELGLPRDYDELSPGSLVRLDEADVLRVVSIEEGASLSLALVSTQVDPPRRRTDTSSTRLLPTSPLQGETIAVVLDLPLLAQRPTESGSRLAVAADPWPGPFVVRRPGALGASALVARVEQRATTGRLLAPLPVGVAWIWDEANRIEVELLSGTLSSAPRLDVLNGANAAAVRTSLGWEVLQFREAVLIGPSRYRLSGLLRGQGGTERLAAAAVGADFVRLDGAVRTIELPDGASNVSLAISPIADPSGSSRTVTIDAEAPRRDLLPLRPVHLRGFVKGSIASLEWTRRDRGLADSWNLVDVPMSERDERYRLEHLRDGALISAMEVDRSEAVLSDVVRGDVVRVAQLSALVGPGPYASLQLL